MAGILEWCDEEEKEDDDEWGHADDEEDVDDINHSALPKQAVRANSPGIIAERADIWKHVRRICRHDVPDHAMKADCTHVCVYRLSDGEGGATRYCNKPLKLFRSTRGKEAPWITCRRCRRWKRTGATDSRPFFWSKKCYRSTRTFACSASECISGLE